MLEAFGEAARRGATVRVVYDGIDQKEKNERAIAEARIRSVCEPRTTGKLMHNKFVVLARKGKPVAVWTGSTNISPRKGLDVLDWYATEVAGKAKDALFMTFAFGMDQRFKDLYRRDDDVLRMALMDRYGSPSTLKRDTKEIKEIRRRSNVLIAIGNRIVTNSFDRWLAERAGTGVKWVHTKFMLRDPLSSDPVVVAGSANFSRASTDTNKREHARDPRRHACGRRLLRRVHAAHVALPLP